MDGDSSRMMIIDVVDGFVMDTGHSEPPSDGDSGINATDVNGDSSTGTCAQGRVCNGSCVDTNSNLTNCGSCGRSCQFANATAQCMRGECVLGACNAGFDDCDGNAANGCEARLDAPDRCGACNRACSGAMPLCNMGMCVADCQAPNILCTGSCVNTSTNAGHCGACGRSCVAANGVANCTAGVCGIASCNVGFRDCNMSANDGCEVNVTSDQQNCGRCGIDCRAPQAQTSCNAGSCRMDGCQPNFANCDGNPVNGCEVNTSTSMVHCGGCDRGCAVPTGGNASCNAGMCMKTCPAGTTLNAGGTACVSTDCGLNSYCSSSADCPSASCRAARFRTAFATLTMLNAACTEASSHFGAGAIACATAATQFCVNQGYIVGWGPLEVLAPDSAAVVCVGGGAMDSNAGFDALGVMQAGCSSAGPWSGQCMLAVRNVATAINATNTGFGPIFASPMVMRYATIPLAQLTARTANPIQPICDFLDDRRQIACQSAIHARCRSEGFISGFGPYGPGGGMVTYYCFSR